MSPKKNITVSIFVLFASLASLAAGSQKTDSMQVRHERLQVPENVKAVLIHEMKTISTLMGDLLQYIVQGDSAKASATAIEIRNTNLKQEFDSKEIKKILAILPKGFIKMDRKFHMTANDVAKAVDTNDFKTAINLYSEMTQSCLNCHTAYASERFKNLSN